MIYTRRTKWNRREEGYHTELMRAALEGDSAYVRALLAGGADVNAKTPEGERPGIELLARGIAPVSS